MAAKGRTERYVHVGRHQDEVQDQGAHREVKLVPLVALAEFAEVDEQFAARCRAGKRRRVRRVLPLGAVQPPKVFLRHRLRGGDAVLERRFGSPG